MSAAFTAGTNKAPGPPRGGIPYCLWGLLVRRHQSTPQAREFADNCYFLGFLYTLTFLFVAFSGLAISPEAELSSRDIIEKFSIALGSTVVGLLFRTLISNSIPDLDQSVDEVRNQLGVYAKSVEAAANEVVGHIDGLGRNVSSLGGQVAEFVEAAQKSSEAVEKNFSDLLEINKRVAGALDEARERFGEAVGKVVSQAGTGQSAVAAAISGFEQQISALAEELRNTSVAAVEQLGSQSDVVKTAAQTLANAPGAIRALHDASSTQAKLHDELMESMSKLSETIARFNTELAELDLAPAEKEGGGA